MSATPWTPGPWIVAAGGEYAGGVEIEASGNPLTVRGRSARAKANRALLQAAPEMAEALSENVRRLSILRNELIGRIDGEAARKFFGVVDADIARQSALLSRIRGETP